jgi:hypothetical protein
VLSRPIGSETKPGLPSSDLITIRVGRAEDRVAKAVHGGRAWGGRRRAQDVLGNGLVSLVAFPGDRISGEYGNLLFGCWGVLMPELNGQRFGPQVELSMVP